MAIRHDLLIKSYRVLLFDELEEYELAIEELTEYLKTNPQNGIAYNNRGLAYSEIGRGEEALLDFAKAMECSPADPMPYMNRGELYKRHKPAKFREAIDDFTRAIEIKGDEATFHRCRAHACLAIDQAREAIDSFSEAIRLEPEFRQTYIDRGETYRKIGDFKNADQDFNVAGKLS